jgi:hypothetical protein
MSLRETLNRALSRTEVDHIDSGTGSGGHPMGAVWRAKDRQGRA